MIHLEVGQPGTGAPRPVIEAARAALDAEKLGYTDALGILPLRRKIAAHYRDWYGAEVDPARVVVTTGSSAGFVLSFLAAFDPGDRVALVEPCYPCYKNILSAFGIEPVALPGTEATRYQPSVELLEAAGPLDGLIVASPSNPTGTMLDADHLATVSDYCREQGIRFISDEIYHGIVYGEPAASVIGLNPDAIVINSFSKYFSMTGWRIGWMILPEQLLRPVECLAQNLFVSAPSLSQYAALAAFDSHDELRANVAVYARNREILLEGLPKAGFEHLAPADGAFYLYADIADRTNDARQFCQRMLAETGVATTPGIDFDPGRGHTQMRFSYCAATADIEEAVRRLQGWSGR
ncbi:MAG: aminotransferase class I/II-fold pyridoxal phosphate-dependent enzyme [Bauldia litoralis]